MSHRKTVSSNLSDSLPNSTERSNNRFKYNKSDKFINNNLNNFENIKSSKRRQNSLIEISSSKKFNKNNEKNNILEEILSLNDKIKQNENEKNEIKIKLINLKEEKKQKQEDIVNLLSNKESIEEIYKTQIYSLINNQNKITNENNHEKKDIDVDKDENFNILLNDIKESDQNQFIEQTINTVNDIFQKEDSEMNKELINIINNSYEQLNQHNLESNDDLIINDFFTKISLFISNQSLGRFRESDINLLLKYLLQINTINKKLEKYIKFVNKKYKEQKKELNNIINELEKINKNLIDKKIDLEKQLKEYESKVSNDKENNNNKGSINSGRNTKIIYSKKYISKSNNFFIKTKANQNNENKNKLNHNEKITKISLISNNSKNEKNESVNIKHEENNYNKRNIKKKNVNIVCLKEKRKIDRRTLLRKINDYTFNISINNNNKNIFTENNSKNKNIDNINDKISINKNENQNIKENNNCKRKNEINFAKKNKYNENNEEEKEEIITYKISTINPNKIKDISNNIMNLNEIDKENIMPNYNSNILRRSINNSRIISNNSIFKNENYLSNSDKKNHNYISIINITNNAPMQNKRMTIGEDEKIYNIDNFGNDNENCDDLNIKTMKIKNNILNKKEENNNFDINNNEKTKNDDDIMKFKKNHNAIIKKSQNSKHSYKRDLTKLLNKNSELNEINGNNNNFKNKNLTLNITSLNNNTNQITPNIGDSNLTQVNQLLLNDNNILYPTENKQNEKKYKSDFFNNLKSTTLKVTKIKELDIKEINCNKLNILSRRKLSKTINIKNSTKGKIKLPSNSGDKVKIQGKNIKKNTNNINREANIKINNLNNEKIFIRGGNSLIKIKKNNSSLDKIEINKNQRKFKAKLSPNVIKKLKLINLPIPKNKILKTDYDLGTINNCLDKNTNNNYSFYQYINSGNFENKYISMSKQSICYYRTYNKNNIKINLEEKIIENLENIGFSKGYISIILKSDLLQFIPKVNNNNEINILLKDIIGIQIEQQIQNIINKQNSSELKTENKLNFFIFNLLISDFQDGKIECVFENFEIFMFWMKYFEEISEYYRNIDYNFKTNFTNNF